MTTNLDTLTDTELLSLRTEAGAAGDYALVDEINVVLGIEIVDGVEMITR